MSVNAKTRNKSNAKRYRQAQAKRRRQAQATEFAEENAHARHVDRTPAPTNALYRMVGTGATGHKGKEVAKLLATGKVRSVRRGGKDAAGPLKEQVGCTLQRGGPMDYLERPTERAADTGNATTNAPHRADQITRYQANRPGI